MLKCFFTVPFILQKLPRVNKELAEKLLDAEESIVEKKTKKVKNFIMI